MITENLEKILEIKNNIKQTLIDKGVASETTKFAEYADAVQNIPAPLTILENGWGKYIDQLSSAKTIGAGVFIEWDGTRAEFPECTEIGSYAFWSCTRLGVASFPKCEKIGAAAFSYTFNLESAYFPVCKDIRASAFFGTDLPVASFPECTYIWMSAFALDSTMTTAYFPVCSSIGGGCFWKNENLESAYFPKCEAIATQAFSGCSKLSDVNIDSVKNINFGAFQGCYKLKTVKMPALETLDGQAFYNCYNLLSVYLLGPSVAVLSTSTALGSTPIAGRWNSSYASSIIGIYGSIFVRASLLESWRTKANWVYYSSRFVGLNDAEIENLEA